MHTGALEPHKVLERRIAVYNQEYITIARHCQAQYIM